MSESHQNLINIWPGQVASLKQIGEADKLLRVACDSSAILNFAEKMKKKTFFLTIFLGPLSIP